MPWLEDLKFPRGYQMGTHKTNYYLFGRRSMSGLSEYYSRIVNCLLKNQKFIE